ncbi:uncharacterized protein LOC112516548 isoform X2 [Cynara cardunculus var. scolymus]|uniref:uncharacterized protein LOC112516548 isoform X2 n=1 Tax=Cynara cardunculus var. scolymus TaxID=59895 RepID=UPI000D62D66C|nr:uncharacterized protein LOC112516548 isoform X2 [Cynara cardunculus var. scolymus]
MASSGKFDLSSDSPDRPLYTTGQRASYITGSMDRSASFSENMENPILSSLPSMSRSTSTVTQGDVTNFLQCLRFDPKSMAAEYKFNRHGDFKRLASGALGIPDDSPSGAFKGKPTSSSSEDLKRLRAGLRESTIKARERVKIFSESLSVVNKCFPSIPSRKRSRPDSLSGDPANGLLADRAVMGGGVGKIGTQNHVPTSVFDFEPQKVEERGKNTVPNKRTRTSMMDQRADARPNTPARSTASVDKDKEVLRPSSSNGLQGEGRALPIVSDGWEKAKMKKKRSVIKADAASSPSPVSTKLIDGYREPKQGIHSRHLTDGRSRLTDSYGFRPGAANGVIGAGKADGISQQASMGGRSSIPKPEQESVSLHDKRERINSSDKERTNNRAVNKAVVREEFISGSPTSSRLHGTARGPRSGTGVGPKFSPVVQRATASNDWDLPHGTSKSPGAVGSTNRKRTLSARSSSPPVTQWADRRPQKISRTARRTNLVPIVSSNDEIPALDPSDVTGSENGPGFARRFQNSPRLAKSKGDHLPSSALSESEESGVAEFRFRDKGKKFDEVEDKSGQNVQKMSTPFLPTRKNKQANGEDHVDGVRRQGRTGRGFGPARVVNQTTVEKRGNMGTAKQLRTARLSFDKSESKSGRPPTRKLADRKAYTRQKHTAVNAAADSLVGSVDGHEELLAAESAVINSSHALSSPFWRQMEPFFAFLSDMDISFLKQQGSIQSIVTTTNPVSLDVDSSNTFSNGPKVVEPAKNGTNRNLEVNPELLLPETSNPGGTPLCQRLLAALITEEDDDPTCSGNDDLKFNVYGSTFELGTDAESEVFSQPSLQNLELNGHDAFGVYGKISSPRSYNHRMSMPVSEIAKGLDHSYSGLLSDPEMTSGTTCSEYHYGNMSMNEKLLLEIQSIGLYPELVPDLAHTGDEDIGEDISDLERKHHEQVLRKKSLLDKLLKSATEARELQEKEFQQHSLDKLIGMAYQKYMSCWGPNAPVGKSASSKLAKQTALAFVKRTLERCQEFETTGKSCFTEPLFREMFISGSSHLNDEQLVAVNDVGSGQIYGNSMERVSGTPTSTGTASLNGAKGKRSDRDREWKGNGSFKVGRPASSSAKGERKAKTKLKQKTTQLSASVNGPLGKISDQHKPTVSSVPKSVEIKTKENDKYESLEDSEEPLDFSHLQLPEMDALGVGDDFGEQGQDIGSWLNIDEEVLQDDDFMGLEIPMDDLSELNMMV